MGDITNYKSVSINEVMNRLELYKHNPSTIQRVGYELLDEITNGQIDIVDPTNPFVFLWEASCMNTALAVNESLVNLRKQYPSLAQTEEELYLHMSDNDYLNRFSAPAETEFTIMIQVNDLLNKMLPDAIEKCSKVIIPRDTQFKVDNYVFTMQYPVVIRKYDNGVVQISYDATIQSPIDNLTTNIIDYTARNTVSGEQWIFFKVPVKQFEIKSTYFPLQKSSIFSQRLAYTDRFFFIRAFYRNENNNRLWQEMKTTHTDQVFDPFVPTVLVRVFNSEIEVSIPLIYFTSDLISGEIRFDIYTTKGQISVNMSNYKVDSFSIKLMAIDEERDINDYTNAMLNLSHYAYCDQIVVGGTNGLDFEDLRKRVIYDSLGTQNLPITPNQLEANVENAGFDLVKNVDVITNRIILATQKLPKPLNSRLITPANIGISTFISNIDYLKTLPNVRDNGDQITILSNNLYCNNNGIINILTDKDIGILNSLSKTALIEEINSKQYLYSPFYYVLDNSENTFELRIYNLDYPLASNLSFLAQNQTLQLAVNTKTYQLNKTNKGYRLTVSTKSGNYYKQLPDGDVGIQLAYYPVGETDLAYINGVLAYKTDDDERVYHFDIETNYNLNTNHQLCIKNALMFSKEQTDTWTELNQQFHLLHYTTSVTSGFTPDTTDGLLGKFMLPKNAVGNTHEVLTLQLGSSLGNLWSRSRSLPTGMLYEQYEYDIPMLYEEDVYDRDPTTGSLFTVDGAGNIIYNVIHHKNDPVLDENNNPVYRHRKGDVKLDANGNPVLISDLTVDKEIDMLFIDGRYQFADDVAFQNYRNEIVAILDTWITKDLITIQNKLLEKTKIFFYPKTTLGKVKILTESSGEDYISAEQSFILDLDVAENIYSDNVIRQNLIDGSVKILDKYISGTVVNTTEILEALRVFYGSSVMSLSIHGLGGSKDYRLVRLADEHNRLCIKKILEIQQDMSLIIKEDIVVNFHKIS